MERNDLENKSQEFLDSLDKEIQKRLSEYLEMDIKDFFKPLENDIGSHYIFGGAVRDAIAGFDINNIDLICMPNAAFEYDKFLKHIGFSFQRKLGVREISEMYDELSIINEPWTYTKGEKVVQIIRPTSQQRGAGIKETMNFLKYIIGNVDISVCGMAYDSRGLHSYVKGALDHSLAGMFKVMPAKGMYNEERTKRRAKELELRGWQSINGLKDIKYE